VELDSITGAVVDCAMKVHTALGPGMPESVYEKCLTHELVKRGFKVEAQVWLPVIATVRRSRAAIRSIYSWKVKSL
jgi:GxxExxY protein